MTGSTLRNRVLRLFGLAAVLIALIVAGRMTGVTEGLTLEVIRAKVETAGALGYLVFVAGFTAGALLQVPGMLFVGAAILAWGRLEGFLAAWSGAGVATGVSFLVVRAVGGQVFTEIDRPLFKKLIARLDRNPILVVAGLRVLFWLAPPLNYALALSSVRFVHYVAGTMIGLLPPLLAATLLFDLFFN